MLLLWNIAEHEERDTTDTLWGYSLLQFTDITVPPHNSKQRCVEVHDVISQFTIENMNSDEVITLSPYYGEVDTCQSVSAGLIQQFQRQFGYKIHSIASIPATDCLKLK